MGVAITCAFYLFIRPGSVLIFLARRRQHTGMIKPLLCSLISVFKTHRSLAFENLALRQQLVVLQRSVKRPRLSSVDRGFWVLLRRVWADWDSVLVIVKPQTVVRWHRFIALRHERRRIVHFNVTDHPSAEWTAQQIVDVFPWDTAPRYMLRDRDGIYGRYFNRRVAGLGLEQVLTAPRSLHVPSLTALHHDASYGSQAGRQREGCPPKL